MSLSNTMVACALTAIVISAAVVQAGPVPLQPGISINAGAGPTFIYTYNSRIEGVDDNPKLEGDIGFMVEDSYRAYASFFTDATVGNGTSGRLIYTFVTDPGYVFGDISVSSYGGVIVGNAAITLDSRAGGGAWTQVWYHAGPDIFTKPTNQFSNLGVSEFQIRYSLNTMYGDENDVQLFRSWGVLGQSGDYTLTVTGTVIPEPAMLGTLGVLFSAMLLSRAARTRAVRVFG